MSLNIGALKNNKNEILKAEIASLLFNLGKTHIGFWHKRNGKDYWIDHFGINNDTAFKTQFKSIYGYEVFGDYREYFTRKDSLGKTPFEIDTEKTDPYSKLSNFLIKNITKLFNKSNKTITRKDIEFIEILKGSESDEDLIKKVFFRGCENINSGIDKGSPKKQLDSLYLANAFGSYKRDIKIDDLDKSRLRFFQKLHRFLEDKGYYKNPDWKEIRKWIFDEIKSWYSKLLSDSRFPVNDVTLWDQAYMSGSMFKSALAAMFLDNSKLSKYLDNPQSIKWSILGVQYDKLSLAEKGLKAASIEWYRNTSNEVVDDEIKSLIETDYALGNEVYRDETGIYFIVPENIRGDKDNFYKLHNDLKPLKDDIQKIFIEKFEYEVLPAIVLSEPSRGLMNLGYLIEKAKENYLKVQVPVDFANNIEDDTDPHGICQICGIRLAHKEDDEENLICSVCRDRQKGRIDDWIDNINKDDNINKETIWTDELQDKNGRIALITLKFELGKWLNGDLVNSLMGNDVNYSEKLVEVKNFIYLFFSKSHFKVDTKKLDNQINKIRELIKKEIDKNKKRNLGERINELTSLRSKLSKIENLINEIRKSNWYENPIKDDIGLPSFTGNNIEDIFGVIKELYDEVKSKFRINALEYLTFFPIDLSEDAYKGCKNNGETFDDYIRQIFFGSIVGNEWQELVKKHPLNSKISWTEERIDWSKLTNDDIDFLSQILLQLLLRKNPSPARLKRIWETTREFFEELESKIVELAGIKEERRKRLVWHDVTDKDGQPISDGEYEDGDIVFWATGGNVYLITSIEKIDGKKSFKPKKVERENNELLPNIYELHIEDAEEQSYSPYFTILKPTPISWQFIIPAENVPKLIENIKKEYYKNFKWVYGKLPLHIGIVIQNYKRPLYIGIKALRNIRRDGVKWEDLREEIDTLALKSRQKIAFHYQASQEKKSDCENHYSLFEKITNNGKYEFYLYPKANGKYWIDTTQNSVDTERFYFYPNTLDFEFLDTNARRNDIFYKKDKRLSRWKRNRPYDLYNWQYFEKFKEYFGDKKSSSKLQKLISLIYSKIEDWEDTESIKLFMRSAFVNVLELKTEEDRDKFSSVVGLNKFDEVNTMDEEEFKKKLYMLLDIFEFWHKGLKEV